jgi:hypothetical protein
MLGISKRAEKHVALFDESTVGIFLRSSVSLSVLVEAGKPR